ncbi:uncharacterized protein [Montipora foliosa]|uniref:uncharacterized protein n=1 Tax=Montipora foliosa TaxID=591990 RepID=UPI0035F19A6B
MANISILKLAFVALLSFNGVAGEECKKDQFKQGGRCTQCPPCPPGEQITDYCGHNSNGEQTGNKCTNCTVGINYNDGNSTKVCKNCLYCKTVKKVEIWPCTPTSNTVCACPKGTYESEGGDCVKSPTPDHKATKATPKVIMTPSKSPMTSMTSTAKPLPSYKQPDSLANTTQMKFPTPNFNKATDKDKPLSPFRKPGWIVLVCLIAVILGLLAIAAFHARTRKKISSHCCGKYGELSTEGETTSVLVEGHHNEPATEEPINNARPIPPYEEPMSPTLRSHSITNLCCNSGTEETANEQKRCTCNIKTSETSLRSLDKLTFSSLSAETISDEWQERGNIPSHFSSRSDHRCVTTNSSSNGRTPSPPGRRSPDHHCVTSYPFPTHVIRSQAQVQSPGHSCATCSANSSCVTASPYVGRSPEHRCVTPSSWSTCTSQASSSCRVSPDPSIFSSLHSHSSSYEDQGISNQSGGSTQSNYEMQSIPVSVEAFDKEYQAGPSKPMAKKNPLASKRNNESRSVEGRQSPTAKQDLSSPCKSELRPTELLTKTETGDDKEREMTQRPEEGTGFVVMKVGVTPRSDCSYRPYPRNKKHRCQECCPQPDDLFFQLIIERLCLKEQICKELNKNFKELAISARVEKEIGDCETTLNPAEHVLDTIKASYPRMRLSEFNELLLQIKRRDIVELIQNHHLSCSLCQRNRFDSNA